MIDNTGNLFDLGRLKDDYKGVDDIDLVTSYRLTKDNVFLESLLYRYSHYINKILAEMYNKYKKKYSWDDIKQEIIVCFIGIVEHKFKVDNGVKFFTYMYKTLKLDSLKFIRDDKFYRATCC